MAVYLIDTENVHSGGMVGISKLSRRDRVCVFYSDKSASFRMDIVEEISKAKCPIEFLKTQNGDKNALDFQLVAYLSFHAKKIKEAAIISQDKGYQSAISQLRMLCDIKVLNANSIQDAMAKFPKKEPTTPTPKEISQKEPAITKTVYAAPKVLTTAIVRCQVPDLCGGAKISEEDAKMVVLAWERNPKSKMALYNDLRMVAGNEKGTNLYKMVSPAFERWTNKYSQCEVK